ncbi:ionotropic receptor 76a [Haematobia irritans]|uniref:ionotropic receptor 76a n=1 Tax=Haematobia irritans TaxID=7368 RepID=UPI003F501AB8
MNDKGIFYDIWTRKYLAAIENTFCEGFVVFHEDIPKFLQAFHQAALYSRWRSQRNRYIFAHTRDWLSNCFFEDRLFKNSLNILVIEMDLKNTKKFMIKTNKFIGPSNDKPQQLFLLTTFDAEKRVFNPEMDLFPDDRLNDLQGREIITGIFDYRPFMALDFHRQPLYYDHAYDNPRHLAHIDGTDVRILHTFCELYNCTVEVDTSEKGEWGKLYPNYTSTGLLGMTIKEQVEIVSGGMYYWDLAYQSLDQTAYLGTSRVTCMVPAPGHLTSWTLIIQPFQATLWLIMFFYLIFEMFILFFIRQFEISVEKSTSASTTSKSWKSSLKFAFATSINLLVSQPSGYMVKTGTLRILLGACYMIDIVISNIYGGGLAAILTLPAFEEAADSTERLYSHNLSWAGTSYVWIDSIDNPDHSEPIIDQLVSNFHIITMDEMHSKAKSANMGFAVEMLTFGHFGNVNYFSTESLTRLKLMVDDIYFQFTVANVPRLWAMLPKYNDLILQWHASGLNKFWEWKITAAYMDIRQQDQMAASRHMKSDGGAVKLSFENFAGLMILWIIGIVLSILIFAGECMVFAMQQKYQGIVEKMSKKRNNLK